MSRTTNDLGLPARRKTLIAALSDPAKTGWALPGKRCAQTMRRWCACALVLLMLPLLAQATQFDIVGPAGSERFGASVRVLPNGNFVVTDPGFDAPGPVANVGAVYLYSPTGSLISVLTGTNSFDQVGSAGVAVLANGNYVIRSPLWNGRRGAVTWASATDGAAGTVSEANSLIGGAVDDRVGSTGVTALANGNFLVRSADWDATQPPATNAGAITWGNGAGGLSGLVSAANSLVGSSSNDAVGSLEVVTLGNGHYVVRTPGWDDPVVALGNVGAVTWGDGDSGTSGVIHAGNSLVGGSIGDQVGSSAITELANGNFVVISPNWGAIGPAAVNVGAVTWADGNGGTVGLVSAANSLVGGGAGDLVGNAGVTALVNGNYVVGSANWDGGLPNPTGVGAATWGDGNGGTVGVVSAANSLVGGSIGDGVGNEIVALANGHYVAAAWAWDSPAPFVNNVGAVTWGNGNGGTVGLVTASNSLVGSTAFDNIGFSPTGGSGGITALSNGNYVVRSANWGGSNVGAVTWGNGTGGTTGPISAANSLIGSTENDSAGGGGITALANGNYVVNSPSWDASGPAVGNVGAVTWGDGNGGTTGAISASNSLVGVLTDDGVGSGGIAALANGNYVVRSPNWDAAVPAVSNVGAVTWANGSGATTGPVSAANSLIGSSINDMLSSSLVGLSNGNFVVVNAGWNGSRGAVTWGSGTLGLAGTISVANSLVGVVTESRVGSSGIVALADGNFVVRSPSWASFGPVVRNVGAVTWGNGLAGTSGEVSAANSLVGGTAEDRLGNDALTGFPDGKYIFRSSLWNATAPALTDSGAVTLGLGGGGSIGVISSVNSVLGTSASNGAFMTFTYDMDREQMVVGRSRDNIVTVFSYRADGDELFADGFERVVPMAVTP